jgi:hypothetical protein
VLGVSLWIVLAPAFLGILAQLLVRKKLDYAPNKFLPMALQKK